MRIRVLDKRQTEQEEFYRSVVTDEADWAEFRRLNYKFSQCHLILRELREQTDAITHGKTRLSPEENATIERILEQRRRICARSKEFARQKYAIIEKYHGKD